MIFRLFEQLNATNQSSPRFPRHLDFAKPVAKEVCERVTLLDSSQRCDYATYNEVCRRRYFLLNYNSFFYCKCDDNDLFRFMCILLLLITSALMFWMIYFITNFYFVPALTGIAKALNMNEYIAGLTIMTMGNNAPDIFGSIVTLNSTSRHIYTDAMSVNLFICVFTSSVVMWVSPFAINGFFFLRDVGFVLLYVSYVDFSIKQSNGVLSIGRAVSMALVLPIYILVIICDLYLQFRRDKEIRRATQFNKEPSLFRAKLDKSYFNVRTDSDPPNKDLFRQFIRVFDTLDRERFNSKWFTCKLWALVKVPPLMVMRLLIPQMHYSSGSYSWSKLLYCIQITLTPLAIISLYIEIYLKQPTWTLASVIICFACFMPFSVYAFLKSRTDSVPHWHQYIVIMNILGCLLGLYSVTTELVALLETVGITLHRSHTFIGCTLFTWGSGMATLMTNLGMARKGFPRMAYSSCFGVIIFSTFASVCLPVLVHVIYSPDFKATEGTFGETTSDILIMSLIMIILYGITTNFMLRRSGALLGITIYVMYVIFSVASEFELIHAYGTDHSLDRSQFDESYSS